MEIHCYVKEVILNNFKIFLVGAIEREGDVNNYGKIKNHN